MAVVAPKLVATTPAAKQLFAAFDSDSTGSVDVDELFSGLGILNPSFDLATNNSVCFDLFDHNGDGFISGADIVHMLWTIVRLNHVTIADDVVEVRL